MNPEQITSIVRQILLVLGGGLVSRGWVDSGTLEIIIGAVLALAASAWAIYTRRANGLIAATAALPQVQTVVTDAATAATVPAENVVAPPAS